MAYDAADGQVVLFGGFGSSVLGDTWTPDGTDWTQQSPAHTPHKRTDVGMTYDGAAPRSCCSEGLGGKRLGDTWTGTGPTGPSRVPSTRRCPQRRRHRLRRRTGEILLFGGFDTGPLSDTWAWDGDQLDPTRMTQRRGARSSTTAFTPGSTASMRASSNSVSSREEMSLRLTMSAAAAADCERSSLTSGHLLASSMVTDPFEGETPTLTEAHLGLPRLPGSPTLLAG